MSWPLLLREKAVLTLCQAYPAFYVVILYWQLNSVVQYPSILSSFLPTRTTFLTTLDTCIPTSFLLSPLPCVPSSPVKRPPSFSATAHLLMLIVPVFTEMYLSLLGLSVFVIRIAFGIFRLMLTRVPLKYFFQTACQPCFIIPKSIVTAI